MFESKVSFIIPVYNHLNETQQMVNSLLVSLPDGLDYEIIISDDASNDGTTAWLKTLRNLRVKTLFNKQNLGYSANNNVAVQQATGEFLFLLNNDLLFESGWLEPLLTILLSKELNAGLVGNLQYRVDNNELDHAGIYLSPNAQFHHIRSIPKSVSPLISPLALTGACMLIRKADFELVGGFDEHYVNGCEDIDLCFKIRSLGKNIYVSTISQIKHHVSLTRKDNSLQNILNSLYLFSIWRKYIKLELTRIWRELIVLNPTVYEAHLNGRLERTFIETPHIASSIIAEYMLNREAAHCDAILDAEKILNLSKNIEFLGMYYSYEYQSFVLQSDAIFFIKDLIYIRNFYICGYRLGMQSDVVRLSFNINNIQFSVVDLGNEKNFNQGIVDPLFISGVINFISVNTTKPLAISHFVIDDVVVDIAM
jgi:GT2 family glycosyltransferase